jgi:hypothetical protein
MPASDSVDNAIAECRAQVAASLRETGLHNRALEAEKKKLLDRKAQLQSNADSLRRRAALEPDAAAQWQSEQIQLSSIEQRLGEVENQFRQPDWSPVNFAVDAVVRHYVEFLRETIGDFMFKNGLAETAQRGRDLAGFTDPVVILSGIRPLLSNYFSRGFHAGNWFYFNKIFERALKRRIHLGIDFPDEAVEDSNPADKHLG